MVEQDKFLEYAEVYGNYYGTSRDSVASMLSQGTNVLLDIDWQGARIVKQKMPEAVSVSILPPSLEELERRLRSRGSDSEDVIRCRMKQAVETLEHCRESDFLVLNDNFNAALDDLALILGGESDRLRPLNIDIDAMFEGNKESPGTLSHRD